MGMLPAAIAIARKHAGRTARAEYAYRPVRVTATSGGAWGLEISDEMQAAADRRYAHRHALAVRRRWFMLASFIAVIALIACAAIDRDMARRAGDPRDAAAVRFVPPAETVTARTQGSAP